MTLNCYKFEFSENFMHALLSRAYLSFSEALLY